MDEVRRVSEDFTPANFLPRGVRRYPSEVTWIEQGARVAYSEFDGPMWPLVVLGAREALGKVMRWDNEYALALALWRGVP